MNIGDWPTDALLCLQRDFIATCSNCKLSHSSWGFDIDFALQGYFPCWTDFDKWSSLISGMTWTNLTQINNLWYPQCLILNKLEHRASDILRTFWHSHVVNIHNLFLLILLHLNIDLLVYQHVKTKDLIGKDIESRLYGWRATHPSPQWLSSTSFAKTLKSLLQRSSWYCALRPDIDTWCVWAWLSSSWLLWRWSPRRSPWWSCWSSGWPCCWSPSSLKAGSKMRQPWPKITVLFCFPNFMA